MPGCRILQVAIDDLEGARERHAEPAHDHGQLILGIFAISRPSGGCMARCSRIGRSSISSSIFSNSLDALLQALGDGQLERLDHSPAICLRDGFSANQQVVNLPIDEIAVALEILLVDIEPGRESGRIARIWPRS